MNRGEDDGIGRGGGDGGGGGKATPFARRAGDDGRGLFARGGADPRGGQEKPFARAGAGDGCDQAKPAAGGGGGDDGGDQPKVFAGVRFKLLGFKPEDERKYRLALEIRGATHSTFYGPDSGCTHVIVNTYSIRENQEWCVKARKGNAFVVNHLWLRHIIRTGQLLPAEKGMYKPFSGGLPGSLSLSICCLACGPEDFEDIKLMVYLMGGSFLDKWNSLATHAICFRCEATYNKQAKEKGTKLVNVAWLSDSLNAGKIMPSDDYYALDEKTETAEENSQTLHPSFSVSTDRSTVSLGFGTPTERTANQSLDRVSKSTGKRPRTESNSSRKPSCVRSLQYSTHKSVSVDLYVKAENRVISVQYPFERTPKELTDPVLKRILLKAYVRLSHPHNANRSLGGRFGCKNFLVSEPNEIVELCDITLVDLTPDNRAADKKAFVNMARSLFGKEEPPADVSVWLENIEGDWQDALLLNHIYMGETETTWGQFITLYYCLKKLEGDNSEKYKDFLLAMRRYKNWYAQGFKWTTLEANKDYQDRRDIQLAKYESRSGKKKKSVVDPHRNTAHGALKAIKNTWSHPAKALQEYFLAIILRECKYLLCQFQKAMFDSGYYGKQLSIKQFI